MGAAGNWSKTQVHVDDNANVFAYDNATLKAEVESLRSRVAAGETLSTELAALRDERDLIRNRVGEMLSQLDALEI